MTQENSKDKAYKSISTGQLCDAAQYLAEIMVMRSAEKNNISGLEYKFWNKSQKAAYISQIVAVKRLIKKYGEHTIISFVSENKNIYSLGRYNTPAFIKEAIEKHHKKILAENSVKNDNSDKVVINTEGMSHRPSYKKTSLFSKIKRADNNNGEK